MDNSGHGPLQVPGFGSVSLDQQLEYKDRFAHSIGDWVQTPAVTVREFAMVALMNTITDKPDWHTRIFDDEDVERWHAEAFAAQPLISERAWVWCVAELRDKAEAWKTHHFIRVLDTGSCICKADAALIPEPLRVELASGIDSLRVKNQELGSASPETDVVDPYLFPLVYGKSQILSDGGQVDLKDPLSFYAEARVVPAPYDERTCTSIVQKAIEKGEAQKWRWMDGFPAMSPEAYYWSYTFQCLPCEVQFTGESGTDVEITSYINNLHPAKVDVYRSLEKLLSLVIRPWNDCITKGQEGSTPDTENNRQQRGPVPLRIVTYGAEWDNLLPDWALAFREVPPSGIATDEEYQEAVETLRNASKNTAHLDWVEQQELYWQLIPAQGIKDRYEWAQNQKNVPGPSPELWALAKEYIQRPSPVPSDPSNLPGDWNKDVWTKLLAKQKHLMTVRHPEPGIAFSYTDWKTNSGTDRAVIDMVPNRRDMGDYDPTPSTHTPYTICLEDEFRAQGLQVIVKIGGIELTPENPSYDGSAWHLERQLNDHIIATAVYAYDVENVTQSWFSFQQETDINANVYQYEFHHFEEDWDHFHKPTRLYGRGPQTELRAIEEILGFTDFHLCDILQPNDTLPFQEIGRVALPQGRLITFPNTMEHRREPLELIDVNTPGHHRYITLHLVDPHYRVASTRNVPPQQHEWWAAAVGRILMDKGLPVEIADYITSLVDGWLMRNKEAQANKQQMMKEEGWMTIARNYCMALGAF